MLEREASSLDVASIVVVPATKSLAPTLFVSVVVLDWSAEVPLLDAPPSALFGNPAPNPEDVEAVALGSAALLVAFSGGGVVTRSKLKHCPGI